MVKVLVLIAPGFEPVEAITPIDFLRRAGAEVTTAAVGHNELNIKSAHDITMKCDVKFESVHTQLYDAIVCPGGMPGTKNLAKDAHVLEALKAHNDAGKVVAAICAAPGFVLAEAAQLLKGKNACGYPGSDAKITENGGNKLEDPVVIDGNIVTSRGPGTASKFALALIGKLFGDEKANEIGSGTLVL
ncbi:putative DJ-1 family protein [Tritrichomonas foetus]|uniref:Putative DJ-1 family protein n=1 Tax=Tritrichomonas foetus TaxID=1144522 RepID=A0A1J4JPT9_9EUKA|nr:putative DJ-1 family protein [Tritrichomonas foetus]OHT01121.1 putative DJ-1 family protein [Tritrichomonas foetus]|eukprot:OHT01121.1 putative DJ-1 family protein [Tritrichomonas foetus]